MQEGMNLDPQVLINVMTERIAAAAIREARLTAGIQQLTMEKMRLEEQWADANTPVDLGAVPEVEDANADDDS